MKLVRDMILSFFDSLDYKVFTFSEALLLATLAHRGDKDSGGVDYIKHPLHISHKLKLTGRSNETQMAGLLHDVVEDTDINIVDLINIGVPESVTDALSLLTHIKDQAYIDQQRSEYISSGMQPKFANIRAKEDEYMKYGMNLAKNCIARDVKIEDLNHNSDVTRVTDKDLEQNSEYIGRRNMKYAKLRRYLTGGQVGY